MKLVLVEWDDACSGTEWESRGFNEDTQGIVSVGILVKEDNGKIELLPNISPSRKLHQIAIPKGCIKRMRKLHL